MYLSLSRLLFITLISSSVAQAQPFDMEGPPNGRSPDSSKFGHEGSHGFSKRGPGGRFARQDSDEGRSGDIMQIFRQVQLSDEQKRKLASLLKDQRSDIRESMEQLRNAREKLQSETQADEFSESNIRSAARELGEAQGTVSIARAKMLSEAKKLLTPKQRELLHQARNEGKGRRFSKREDRQEQANHWIDRHAR